MKKHGGRAGPAVARGIGAAGEDSAVRAAVLCPVLWQGVEASGKKSPLSIEARIAEAEGLARAIGLVVAVSGAVPTPRPRPATLFGRGKVDELSGLMRADDVRLAIVDHPLSPVQQRNLEKAWEVKVLDRTGLILEIFGQRARTREGALQVELAHLNYQKSRLVRTWTHLERQRGGFGFMGGPGERQIEADRRMIQERIDAIRRELETVKRTRGLHRESRRRVPYPVVALVGYTNAGKSTLFNKLSGAGVRAEDMLFATLDPTMREIRLPGSSKAIVSDTVGFISHLPTTLIAAFRATLEEVIEADLILHVRDISHEQTAAQLEEVESILCQLGIDPREQPERLIEVWNKIDLLDEAQRGLLANRAERAAAPPAVCVSSITGEGMDRLLSVIETRLNAGHVLTRVEMGPGEGALAHWLHENSEVVSRTTGPDGASIYVVRLSPAKHQALESRVARPGTDARLVTVTPDPAAA